MDSFNLIQNFFTRMRCNFCSHSFAPEDIQLIRKDEGLYIVNVFCNHCRTQNGVAMVGVEAPGAEQRFEDPELTEQEMVRLADFRPVSPDDVLDAHEFFGNLGSDWMKFIPSEMIEHYKETQTESPAD